MINLAILGASGSIGKQALELAEWHPGEISITALAVGGDWRFLADMARKFRPALIAVAEERCYAPLRAAVADLPVQVAAGDSGLAAVAACEQADTVLAAISGMAQLRPLLAAIAAGKRICLANKEALVAAGQLVMDEVRRRGVRLNPVDSEHSAIWQCLAGERIDEVARLVLTASGGAFRDYGREQLQSVTPQQALRHPNWRMGDKITVDCATMVNKGLEVMEARWLFDIPYERIDVVIHPQSIVHSMVAFRDGSLKAQLAQADMRLPIHYALFDQARPATPVAPPDLAALGQLTFSYPDNERFPALAIVRQAGERGGVIPAYINGANEVLNAAFRREQLSFMGISDGLGELLAAEDDAEAGSMAAIFAADAEGREAARRYVEKYVRRYSI